ncbi:MAG: four helix bundle protein, partial [Clostridia bacterium]|nr:four helix bundle protein [Clostridia bacterium]
MRKNLEQLIDELNLQIMDLCKSFCGHDELKNQLYRSSTSIGANKAEA